MRLKKILIFILILSILFFGSAMYLHSIIKNAVDVEARVVDIIKEDVTDIDDYTPRYDYNVYVSYQYEGVAYERILYRTFSSPDNLPKISETIPIKINAEKPTKIITSLFINIEWFIRFVPFTACLLISGTLCLNVINKTLYTTARIIKEEEIVNFAKKEEKRRSVKATVCMIINIRFLRLSDAIFFKIILFVEISICLFIILRSINRVLRLRNFNEIPNIYETVCTRKSTQGGEGDEHLVKFINVGILPKPLSVPFYFYDETKKEIKFSLFIFLGYLIPI